MNIRSGDLGPDDPHQRLFDLAASQFMLEGTWPSLKDLTRAAAQRGEADLTYDSLHPIPAHLGGFGFASGDSISLSAAGLAKTEIGRPLVTEFVRFVRHCYAVYVGPDNPPRVTSAQLREDLEMSETTVARIGTLLNLSEGYLINSGSPTSPEEWWWEVNENILKFKNVSNLEEFLEVREQLRPPPAPLIPSPGTLTGRIAAASPWSAGLAVSPADDALTLDSLHPYIAEAARDLFFAKPAMAVFAAAKALSAKLRHLTGLSSDGTPLVEEAFKRFRVGDPDSRTGENLHEGTRLIALGIMRSMRNIGAHDDYELTHVEAFEALGTISLVVRRLDLATPVIASGS